MQVVLVDGAQRRELDIRVNNPAATVADLVAALEPASGRRNGSDRVLLIGDQEADLDFDLSEAGLHEGAIVRLGESRAAGLGGMAWPAPAGADRELAVVNGLNAGRRFALTPGTTEIGRAPTCKIVLPDATISKQHACVSVDDDGEVVIEDLGSHNGTWLGGEAVVEPTTLGDGVPVRLGALELEVRPARDGDRSMSVDPLRHANSAGTIPFNRPPRPASPPPPEQIIPPKPPQTGQSKAPLGVIGIVAPIIFAGVMFAVMKNAHFLLFAGLTPLMGIASAIDSKRRGRKTERNEKDRFQRQLGEFRERLATLVDEERARRRDAYPDPTEIMRRVSLPSTTLWERRPGHPDFLKLQAGVGDVPWVVPVPELGPTADLPAGLKEALDAAAVLPDAPVPVDLSGGGVVGIVGDRSAALALARSLICQAATLHGPADLPVMVLASPEGSPAWDWAKWLPHTRDASGAGRMLSDDPELSARMAESRLKEQGPRDRVERRQAPGAAPPVGPTVLVVVDDESLTEGRKAPTRSLLRGDGGLVAGIVIATRAERLPAACTTVIEMTDPDGQADLMLPQQGVRISEFLAAGMADDVARDCARRMARFEDPELDIVGAGLPASIRLLPLLDFEDCDADAVLARWTAAGTDPRPAGPIGVSENGVFSVDFMADGPHALVGGTTGAGKSELLRTMVAGLAASVDPDHLTFVLIDFKGGAAFDECAKLPHTVGMVTDLDEHLAERALRCLEAELKHRERALRAAGAIDLPDYLRNNKGSESMPRLLVIIDEFATLKAELPDFIDALVGVAQRGRSLGVHMLLATQRPQGAINDNIKANTNLRIALRVQDKTDSSDVIDVPDAANIPRTAPGRAYVRLGPNEVVAIQTALSTGSRDAASQMHVDVAPFVYGPAPRPPDAPRSGSDGAEGNGVKGETDLSVLVAAIEEAFAHTGQPRPRRPWPDPLPGDIDLDAVIHEALASAPSNEPLPFVPIARADDPDAQSQYPMGWARAEGNLLLYGIGGSGTTTALSSLVLSLARLHRADDVHIYVLDFGAGELEALQSLPHVGAVIQSVERERQARLVRHLRTELDRRRELGLSVVREQPVIVTLIDGWSALADEYGDFAGGAVIDAFSRVYADGPEVGMFTVIAADRASAIPSRLASLARQRLALRLADTADYSSFGIRSSAVPQMAPGRALVGGTGQLVQIARPADGVAAAAARLAASAAPVRRPPLPIETLKTTVKLSDLDVAAKLDDRPWTVPVGIAEKTLQPAGLVVYQGEHALIAGPARSGKSTALLTVAAVCRRARSDLKVLAVAGRRSPLADDPLIDGVVAPADIGTALAPLVEGATGPVLVLVDDAESIDDSGNVLDRLSTSDRPDLLFVAAGRNDGVRTNYSHWTRPLRRSRLGVLLRPEVDLDGDMLGTKLPRRAPVGMVSGRGYLVNSGDAELIQVAVPR